MGRDGRCYLTPVQYLVASVYPELNSTTNVLSWVFTTQDSVFLDSP